MKIEELGGGLPKFPQIDELNKKNDPRFGNIFSDFIKSVNQDQTSASQMTKDFVNGEDVELHEVMIAGEKAKTSLDLLIEIRNKAVDMYKELTRMQ